MIGNSGVTPATSPGPSTPPRSSGTADVGERGRAAFADALAMAERAAVSALDAAGLAPADIDAIVTTHTTSWAVPNLDIHLVTRLGLRPTVRRVALTTVACPGGTQALIRAADLSRHGRAARCSWWPPRCSPASTTTATPASNR